MKLLIVCRGNTRHEKFSLENDKPFIYGQIEYLVRNGVDVDLFLIKGGPIGYIKNLPSLRREIRRNGYDLIHAHYGLSGMFAVMQRICPVVITYQGCDVNRKDLRVISRIAVKLAAHNIFVSKSLADKINLKIKYTVIPYGVDINEIFFPMDKEECRKKLNLGYDERIVLFSSSFNRVEKNYLLAKKSIELLDNIRLIELGQGYSRTEINELINASDLLLLTSVREGSPQVIKEAMACNCPIVSTDVGDVKELINGIEGCYITRFEPEDVADKIRKALDFGKRTKGRHRIKSLKLDSGSIAKQIILLYNKILS